MWLDCNHEGGEWQTLEVMWGISETYCGSEYAEWIGEEMENCSGVCCNKLDGGLDYDCVGKIENSWILNRFWK